jgi:hypothetical protein
MEWLKGQNLRKSAKTYLSANLTTLHHGILSRDWVWLYTGLGFMTGSVELWYNARLHFTVHTHTHTHKHTHTHTHTNTQTNTNTNTHTHTHTHTLLSTVTSSLPFVSSGFQRRTFPFLWVPELSLCLSYQLLIATAHKDWIAAVLSLTRPLTNSLHSTDLTPRLAAISHHPPTLRTTDSSLSLSNGSWPSIYSLDTDRTEKTASNSSSTVASRSYTTYCVQTTASNGSFIVVCVCCGHYLATATEYSCLFHGLA